MGEFDALDDDRLFKSIRIRRIVAFMIDGLIIIAALSIFAVFGVFTLILTLGLAKPLLVLAAAALPLAYHTFMIGSRGHATLGMRVMGLRVVRDDGSDPDFMHAAIQTVVFYFSTGVTNFLILLVSFFNDRGRCLHDYLSDSVVVNDLPEAYYDQADLNDWRESTSTSR